MNEKSREKVINAGFRIIRKCDYPVPCIKECVGVQAWKIIEKFRTKAERNRAFEDLLLHNNMIDD